MGMNRVCNKFVSALKSPEKMTRVIRNKNSNTNKEDEGSNNEANMRNDLNKVSNKERSQEINMNITNVTKNNANDKTINKENEKENVNEKSNEKEDTRKNETTDKNTIYPCGTCKKDVIDDGIECQRCDIWFHFGSCSDVYDLKVFIKEYRDRNRKFKCTECKKEKRGPGRPKLSKRKSPIKCKVPTKRRTILVEIPLKRNTKRTRKIREDEPSEETITDASKKDKSPIKKRSKADEGKNENENMKFPIKIRGEDVTKTDLDSLEEGQCITSTIMDIFMKLLEIQYEEEIKEHNIQLIKSAPAYLIQKGKKHEITTALLDPIKLWEKGMALMVVSKKDNPDLEGGEHYSLLTYHKNDHTFLHMDPIKGINETCARDLFINSMTKEMIDKDGHLPSYEEGDCTRQENNYDCGPYTICYMWRTLDFIRTGTQFFVSGSTLGVEEKNMRQYMRKILMQEIRISKCMHNTDKSIKKGENKQSMENPKMDKPITAQKITNEKEKKKKEEININKIIGVKIERTKQDMNKNIDNTSNEKNTNINTKKADKANINDNI